MAFQGPSAVRPWAASAHQKRTANAMMLALKRREVVVPAFALAISAAVHPSLAQAKEADEKKDIRLLSKKVQALQGMQGTQAKVDAPIEARAGRVQRKKQSVLLPLLEAMNEKAPTLGLPEEQQKRAESLPQLMKELYSELDEAVSKQEFQAYVSNGREYPGGKVERKLEEIVETTKEFVLLMDKADKMKKGKMW